MAAKLLGAGLAEPVVHEYLAAVLWEDPGPGCGTQHPAHLAGAAAPWSELGASPGPGPRNVPPASPTRQGRARAALPVLASGPTLAGHLSLIPEDAAKYAAAAADGGSPAGDAISAAWGGQGSPGGMDALAAGLLAATHGFLEANGLDPSAFGMHTGLSEFGLDSLDLLKLAR